MDSQTGAGASARTRRNILILWIGGFVVPPVGWVLGNWFLGLWSARETLAVTLSPLLIVYVTGYIGATVFYAQSRMNIITSFLADPNTSPQAAQRTVAAVPKGREL